MIKKVNLLIEKYLYDFLVPHNTHFFKCLMNEKPKLDN